MRKINILKSISALALCTSPTICLISCGGQASESSHTVILKDDVFYLNDRTEQANLKFYFEDKFIVKDNFVSVPTISISNVYVINTEDEVTEYPAKDIFVTSVNGLKDGENNLDFNLQITETAANSRTYSGSKIYLTLKVVWVEGENLESATSKWDKDFSSLIVLKKQIDDSIEKRIIRNQYGCIFKIDIDLANPVPEDCEIIAATTGSKLAEPLHVFDTLNSILSSDRKTVSLYCWDGIAEESEYEEKVEWSSIIVKCYRPLPEEKKAETLWSQKLWDCHFEYNLPSIAVSSDPWVFPTGGKEFYIDIDIIAEKITAAGQLKPSVEYTLPGGWGSNNDFESTWFGDEEFTTAGRTKFRFNFTLKNKAEAALIPPTILLKFKLGDEIVYAKAALTFA